MTSGCRNIMMLWLRFSDALYTQFGPIRFSMKFFTASKLRLNRWFRKRHFLFFFSLGKIFSVGSTGVILNCNSCLWLAELVQNYPGRPYFNVSAHYCSKPSWRYRRDLQNDLSKCKMKLRIILFQYKIFSSEKCRYYSLNNMSLQWYEPIKLKYLILKY